MKTAHEPMPAQIAAKHTIDALAAGMPRTSARRWPDYLDMKARRKQTPISLEVAVHQCRLARGEVDDD
ncbi:hypothetical protein ACLQ3K_25745 [Tsukamurella sp. DT100]|uniref:hypothetical protein n=1 Tax=Tsukamurella sp. DT100 TaxID=3393415 RepID=UPI003CEB82E5